MLVAAAAALITVTGIAVGEESKKGMSVVPGV